MRFERSSAGCDAARSLEPALSTRGKTHRVLRARPRVDATPRRVRVRRGVTIPNRVARRKGPLARPLSPSRRVSATRFGPSRGGGLLFFRDAAFTVRKSSIPRPAASRLTKIRLIRRFVYLLLPGVGRRRRSGVGTARRPGRRSGLAERRRAEKCGRRYDTRCELNKTMSTRDGWITGTWRWSGRRPSRRTRAGDRAPAVWWLRRPWRSSLT